MVQSMNFNGGLFNSVVWKQKIIPLAPSAINYQFHSITGDNNQIYITVSSNTSLYGPTGELHVISLDPNTGTLNWDYVNNQVSGGGLLRDIIIKQDNNGDLIVGFLKKAPSSPVVQYAGILKLNNLGVEYWAKGTTIPTPYQGGQFVELHDLGHEYDNGNYILTGVFDHSASFSDVGVFMIYCNETTGLFSDFHEMHGVSLQDDRHPATYTFSDHSVSAFHGYYNGSLIIGMNEIYNGGKTKQVEYSLPTGKTDMYFLKIISYANSLKALLRLETSLGNLSYAVADINPTSLFMTNLTEIDYVSGFNEEKAMDLLVHVNEVYSISRFEKINGSSSSSIPNVYKEIKVSSLHEVLQGNSCFPPIPHSITNTTLPGPFATLNYPQTPVTYSMGTPQIDFFVTDIFEGFILDCSGNTNQVYKKETVNYIEREFSMANPVTNILKFTGEKANTISSVKIFDLKGSLIKINQITGNQTIDIRSLNSGVYIVKVQFENGDVIQKKLIKN